MFSFKQHIRRNAMVVAAVAATVGFAAASQAAVITLDTNLSTYTTPEGGGTIKINGSDRAFTTFGSFSCLTINSLTLTGGYAVESNNTLDYIVDLRSITNSAGNNSIMTPIIQSGNIGMTPVGSGSYTTINVIDGHLTVDKFHPFRGLIRKTGSGVLTINAIMGTTLTNFNNGLFRVDVDAGKLVFPGGTQSFGFIHVSNGDKNPGGGTLAAAATLAGIGTINLGHGDGVAQDRYNIIGALGHVAPGMHDTDSITNFDRNIDVGKITFAGWGSNLQFYGALDLDLFFPDSDLLGDPTGIAKKYDSLAFTGSTGIEFFSGATININDCKGSLEEGIYRIITATGSGLILENGVDFVAGTGFTINAPAGYDCWITTERNGSGITALDLHVSRIAVPEPASLGLLGLGAGLLLLRRKR